MKINPAVKIAIGFALTLGAGWLGFRAYNQYRIGQMHFTDLKPGHINLIAVRLDKGYRINVANQVARLERSLNASGFQDRSYDEGEGDASSRRRIPISAMIGALRGDQKDINTLVMSLNDLSEDSLPPVRKVWRTEDVRAALDGDQALVQKLEADLNVRLDGTPLEKVTVNAIENGIVLDMPVPVEFPENGQTKRVLARVLQPFRPKFAMSVSDRIAQSPPNITAEEIAAIYRDVAQKAIRSNTRENVRANLEKAIQPSVGEERGKSTSSLLSATQILLTDAQITGASSTMVETVNNQKTYTIDINLTPEGRDRAWKYSFEHPGFQLLFVVDGVAVAAPRIVGVTMTQTISITGLHDEQLVNDSVNRIKELTTTGGK